MDKDMQDFMSDDDRIQIEERITIPEIPQQIFDILKQSQEEIEKASGVNIINESLKLCSFNCMEQDTKVCRKCQRQYCILHASRFSPNLCQECFKQVQVVLDKFSRTFEYIGDNGQAHYKKESCSDWHMDGPDWPFLSLWINKMTDEELEAVWMFHYFVIKTIEVENDIRKINKRKQFTNTNPSISRIGQTQGQVKVTTTKTTKTTQVVTAESIREKLKKSGINDPAILDMMVKAAGF